MFTVNIGLIGKIFLRSLIAILICLATIRFTGRIADVNLFLGLVDSSAAGARTLLTIQIFKYIPFYGRIYISIFVLSLASSTIFLTLTNKYVIKTNRVQWYLLLYLPCLLLYTSVASKEFLFFIPATLYIVIECEHLIKNKNAQKSDITDLTNYFLKFILLFFMIQIRGTLSYPYIALATTIFLFKTFNLKFIRIKTLNFSILLLYSAIISFIVFIFVDKSIIINNINNLNKFFINDSILSRPYNFELINNIYNPFTFLKIQFFSFLPSIKELEIKPYAASIAYESIIFFYLFFKSWTKLFSHIKDNQAKNLFSIIFILIGCSYFLIYGFLGYANLGSAQRFRSNYIPISILFPIISESIISRNKLKNNFTHIQNY